MTTAPYGAETVWTFSYGGGSSFVFTATAAAYSGGGAAVGGTGGGGTKATGGSGAQATGGAKVGGAGGRALPEAWLGRRFGVGRRCRGVVDGQLSVDIHMLVPLASRISLHQFMHSYEFTPMTYNTLRIQAKQHTVPAAILCLLH